MSDVIDRDEYMEKLKNILSLYEAGERDYRPISNSGLPGGLIELKEDTPTIVVPDLHGRADFLEKLLNFTIDGYSVIELLSLSSIQVVCVGDGFHSERRGKKRWLKSNTEFEGGFVLHTNIDEEMGENLRTMEYVIELKLLFPGYFHFLKGNHENIKNEEAGGDYPFGKYTSEGEIVRAWVLQFLGEEFLESYAKLEKLFPLVAVGDSLFISHTFPSKKYSREEIINYTEFPDLIHDFTWNRSTLDSSELLDSYLKDFTGDKRGLYVIGHTPVKGRGEFHFENRFLKIHNPDNMYVLYHDGNKGINTIIDINGESFE